MANKYIDLVFENNDYETTKEYSKENAIVLAIRNIILSKPGNFPFHPSKGFDIKKYQFETIDDITIRDMQKELNRAIVKDIPSLDEVQVKITRVEDEYSNNESYLGISVHVNTSEGMDISTDFIVGKEGNLVKIFNESY